MQKKKFRILVVDDSLFMRKLITDILEEDPEIQVVGTAANGIELLNLLSVEPDAITLDIEMPEMDGLAALQKIMQRKATPVIMLSSYTQLGADATIKALELGAVDFVAKPSTGTPFDLSIIRKELVTKVKVAAKCKRLELIKQEVVPTPDISSGFARELPAAAEYIVAIGASTGGPRALQAVLSNLPKGLPAIIVVAQHMPAGFTRSLAEKLAENCAVKVKEAEAGEKLEVGTVYLAPGNYHMEVREVGEGYYAALEENSKINGNCPSVDILMSSVARCRIGKVGVVLTGMGKDGCNGLQQIHRTGGMTIAQDEDTAVIYGMPKAAVETGCVDYILSLSAIATKLKALSN